MGGNRRRMLEPLVNDLDTGVRVVLRNSHTRIDQGGKNLIAFARKSYEKGVGERITVVYTIISSLLLEFALSESRRWFIARDLPLLLLFQNILKGLQPNIKSHAKLPKGEKSAVIPMSESSAGLITKNNSFLSQTWSALAIVLNSC